MKDFAGDLIEIDDTPRHTLTLKFWRGIGEGGQPGLPDTAWICQIGAEGAQDFIGNGPTPLASMRALVERIAIAEGFYTDQGHLLLS